MISLSDIPGQDDVIKLFKPWWDVLKEYLLYAMLFVTVVINGFKFSQEKFICMPATEGNDTCHDASNSLCIVVEEIKSAAFSEYISLACSQQIDLFVKYIDLILLLFPLFAYVLGAIFYNIPQILHKLKDIHDVILHCTDGNVKALETKLDVYIEEDMFQRQDVEGTDFLEKKLELQSLIQSTLKIDSHIEKDIWHVGPRTPYNHSGSTNTQSNTFSNCCSKEGGRFNWFCTVYILYIFLQLAIFCTYIGIIVLFWNESDHETRCFLEEKYAYKCHFFLCRHSHRRVYHHLSFLLLFLSAFFILCILTQWLLLLKGYLKDIKKYHNSSVMEITTDQRFIMTLVYFCKEGYLSNFCRLYNNDIYRKVNSYIAHCKYPYDNLVEYFHKHQNSLRLNCIAALPLSITSIRDIFLLEIVNSDLSIKGTLNPLKDLKGLQQLVLNSCLIQIFDVGILPQGIILLDILNNPLKKIKGHCPNSLNIFSLDKNKCTMKCTNLKNVVILSEKVIRWQAPANLENILSHLKNKNPEQFTSCPGVIHIFNTKINIDDNGNITDVGNTSVIDAFDKAVKDVLFLRAIFSLLKFQVHLHGANDITHYINTTSNENPRSVPKVLIFIFMGEVESNMINVSNVGRIKIVDLIAKFPRLDYLTPAISISLMKDSIHDLDTDGLQTSVWNILYAFVPEASFQDNLIRYLRSEHEDDLASTISGWEDVTKQDFLYKKFYLLPGYPFLDTDLSEWNAQCLEEEKKHRMLKTAVDRYHLSARVKDIVTSMADIDRISALQKSVGRMRAGRTQITCCMIKDRCLLVIARWRLENHPSSCLEFKIGGTWKQFKIGRPRYYSITTSLNARRVRVNETISITSEITMM